MKFLHNFFALAVVLVGALITFNWSGLGLSPSATGEIVMGLGLAKTVLNFFSPPGGGSNPAT